MGHEAGGWGGTSSWGPPFDLSHTVFKIRAGVKSCPSYLPTKLVLGKFSNLPEPYLFLFKVGIILFIGLL